MIDSMYLRRDKNKYAPTISVTLLSVFASFNAWSCYDFYANICGINYYGEERLQNANAESKNSDGDKFWKVKGDIVYDLAESISSGSLSFGH